MTSRERILSAFRGEEPDRLPWAPMIVDDFLGTLPEWPMGEGLEAERARVRTMVRFYGGMGADLITYNKPTYYETRYDHGVQFITRTRDDTRYEFIETPLGTLSSRRTLRDGYSFVMEPFIKTPADCRVYEYYLDSQIIEDDFSYAWMYLEEIGGSGIPFPHAPPPAPKNMLMQLTMEPDHLLVGLLDRNQYLMSLLDHWHRRNLRIYESACRSPLPVFQDTGATSHAMLSPSMYRELCLPQIREYCGMLHSAGKLKVDHAVGEPIKGILADIPGSGIDVLMGFREQTSGNASLEDVLEAFGGEVCLMGGIDTDWLCRFRGDAARAEADSFIRRIGKGDRLVLSTSSAVMPGTPVENMRQISELVVQHCRGWSGTVDASVADDGDL